MSADLTVGFIGLGSMGMPMARRLLAQGHRVVVQNRTRSKAETLASLGAIVVDTPSEVARNADIIYTCLLMPSDVDTVYAGENGLLESVRAGQLCCDLSTVDVGTAMRLGKTLSDMNVGFLDAPISGGVPAAAQGTLAIMVGGSEHDYDRARANGLNDLATHLFHMGPVGSGTKMKLINQLLVSVGEAMTAEAVVFGASAGLSAQGIYDVVMQSSGRSFAFDRVMKNHVLTRNFEPEATVDLIAKDLDCILDLAKTIGATVSFGALARDAFARAQDQGLGSRDLSAVIMPLEMCSEKPK